jgi:hypothetical protein
MNIQEALQKLEGLRGDSEAYHSVYDHIVEKRLRELDPKFMEALEKDAKGIPFWSA